MTLRLRRSNSGTRSWRTNVDLPVRRDRALGRIRRRVASMKHTHQAEQKDLDARAFPFFKLRTQFPNFSKRRRIDLVELADEQWILLRNELMQESPMA